MAAHDTFEWFVSTIAKSPSPALLQWVREARASLLALRSEDERQRFVDEAIHRFRNRE